MKRQRRRASHYAQTGATDSHRESSDLGTAWCRVGCPIVWLARTHVTGWGASELETARELPGDELVPGGQRTTYAITIDAPTEQVWAWLVQIGRGRAAFYTYTWIERLLGADIDNLDYLDPRLQTLNVGDRIWMTPERYLGKLPGQFWQVRSVEPGRALVMDRQPPDSALSATWTLVVEPLPDGRSRLNDRHRGERSAGVVGRVSDTFWTIGTLLMERGMLRGIKARAEQTSVSTSHG